MYLKICYQLCSIENGSWYMQKQLQKQWRLVEIPSQRKHPLQSSTTIAKVHSCFPVIENLTFDVCSTIYISSVTALLWSGLWWCLMLLSLKNQEENHFTKTTFSITFQSLLFITRIYQYTSVFSIHCIQKYTKNCWNIN